MITHQPHQHQNHALTTTINTGHRHPQQQRHNLWLPSSPVASQYQNHHEHGDDSIIIRVGIVQTISVINAAMTMNIHIISTMAWFSTASLPHYQSPQHSKARASGYNASVYSIGTERNSNTGIVKSEVTLTSKKNI